MKASIFAGDGSIGLEEFRLDCVSRMAYPTIEFLDNSFKAIAEGGTLTLARYQELYAEFMSNPDEGCVACNLFGPLPVLD